MPMSSYKRQLASLLLCLFAAWPCLGQTPHTLPAGRAYEMLVPTCTPQELRSMPLVVFLPPPRGSVERIKADWWPVLRERKCLLAMPASKSPRMWLAGEDKYVLDVLADAQTRYSVDGKRIILMGISGGGQFALFLADHYPERWRAVVAVSANPVVVRGEKSEWFYPNRQRLMTCPYLAINPLAQGSALMYWRQVQARLNPQGASISVLPVLTRGPTSASTSPATAPADDHVAPPPELGAWLDAVLAGKQPEVLPDPQRQAVAKLMAPVAAQIKEKLAPYGPPAAGAPVTTTGPAGAFHLPLPAGFQRSGVPDTVDSTGSPLTQLRLEHARWPIAIRVEARQTARPMAEVLSAEEKATTQRGLLYQVYQNTSLTAGGRTWAVKLGAITYPDVRRGWVTQFFAHASTAGSGAAWLTVLLTDETQQPDAGELALYLRQVLEQLRPGAAPATRPAR